MNLVADEEAKVLHILPLLPPSRNDVPLRGSANDDVPLLEQTKVSACLSRQAHDLLATLDPPKPRLPFGQTEINHILIRFDTNRTLGLWLTPQSHQRELRANGLSATCGSTDKDVVVGSVQRLEDLGLDLVERFDGGRVDRLEFFVVEGGYREVLEVEESGRWRELFRKDEMFEGNRDASLRVQPSIRNDGDEVVRWNGFEHWNGDGDIVVHRGVLLPKDERITEEDDFAIDILDEDGERLSIAMNLIVPLEVGDNGEVDAEEGTCNRLNCGLQPEQETSLR